MRAARNGRALRLKRVPHPGSIKPLERAYYSQIENMLKAMRRIVDERMVTALPNIVAQAKAVRPKKDSRSDDYSDDIERIMDGIRVEFYREYTPAEIRFFAAKAAKNVEEFNAKNFQRQFKAVMGIQMPLVEPYLEATVKGFIKQNVSLITSIPDQYFDRVEQTVLREVQSGTLTDEIASEIDDSYDVSESRAALIARDQTAKLNGNLAELRQTEVGVSRYTWSTSLDERVRDSHAAKEGNAYSWDDPPSDTGHPGEDFQCRCVALPIFEESSDQQAA